MQHVVHARPLKILFGKKMGEARQRLIQINQAEADVEKANRVFVFEKKNEQTDCAENNMKNVLSRRAARQCFFRRNYKT